MFVDLHSVKFKVDVSEVSVIYYEQGEAKARIMADLLAVRQNRTYEPLEDADRGSVPHRLLENS